MLSRCKLFQYLHTSVFTLEEAVFCVKSAASFFSQLFVWSNVFWRLSFTFQAFKLISIFRQKLLCHFPPNWFHFEKSQAPVVRLAGLSMKIESKEFFIASIFQTDNSAPSLPHSLKPQTQNKYRRRVFAPCLPDTGHKKPFKMMNSWKF